MPTIGSVTSVVELSGAELIYNIDFYPEFHVVKLYYRYGTDLIVINFTENSKNQTLQAVVEKPNQVHFINQNSFFILMLFSNLLSTFSKNIP